MATTNKPKSNKSVKSPPAPKPEFKKFEVFVKGSDVTVHGIEEYIAEACSDYESEGWPAEYVIEEVPTTEEEFDAAWDAA